MAGHDSITRGAAPDVASGAGPSRILEALALTLLWAALFLPNLARPEFQNEEGRRVIPAREMAASGNYVCPTIFGRPYIAKPPAHYWAIGLAGSLRGRIDEVSARLPSALATLAGALGVLALSARFLSRPAARAGALLFLVTPLVLEKGTLAEIEPLLGVAVFAASALAWRASHGGRASHGWVGAGAAILLAIAVLAKGPAAWVFFLATVIAAAWADRARSRAVLFTGGLVLAASTLLAGVWLALLVRDLGWAKLSATWGAEVTGGDKGPSYLAERATFVLRSLGGFGVGTLLLLLAVLERRCRTWLEPIPVRIALGTSLLGFAFFLVFPRAQARYLYPLAPWMALLAGHVLVRACEPSAPRAATVLVRALSISAAIAGILVLVAALARPARTGGWIEVEIDIGAAGLALAAAMGLLAIAVLGSLRRSPGTGLALSLAILVLARLLQLVEIGARPESSHERREHAARIDAVLSGRGAVRASLWSEFNLLAHVAHPIEWVEDPLSLEPGETVLTLEQGAPAAPSWDWLVLDRIPLTPPRTLVVAERLAPAGGAR